jgi:serine/threonine protein kinase
MCCCSELFRKIKNADFTYDDQQWKHIDPSCKILVSGLLTVDPHKRLTAANALNSEWVSWLSITTLSR